MIEAAAARSVSVRPVIGSPNIPTKLRYMTRPNAFQTRAINAATQNQRGAETGDTVAMAVPFNC